MPVTRSESSRERTGLLGNLRSWSCLGNGSYAQLLKFIFPLAFTTLAVDIGEQALFRGLSGSIDAVDNLAAFGIAYTFVKLFVGATTDLKHVSLVLAHSRKDLRKIIFITCIIGGTMLSFSLVIGLTPVGHAVIDQTFDLSMKIGDISRRAFTYLSFFPFLDALAAIFTGLLLQFKLSGTAGIASILDIAGQVLSVVTLLHMNIHETNAILIPVIATYVGTFLRLLFVIGSYLILIHKELIPVRYRTVDEAEDSEVDVYEEETVTVKKMLLFWFPLAFVQIGQRVSRPICNLFVARDRIDGFTREEAAKAVAVLSVCYPIGHLPYGWLNNIKTLEPTFAKRKSDTRGQIPVKKIRIFNFMCFCCSMAVMVILFVIPGVARAILANVSHLTDAVIKVCIPVLYVFVFFPIPVSNRATCTSFLIKRQKTSWLYPTVVLRIICIFIFLNVLPRLGVHGALMGVSSLLSGFLSESILVMILTFIVMKIERRRDHERALAVDAEI